jgi:ssDNA-binding Zn-finger/Zn-ribbon topoisomerase 1
MSDPACPKCGGEQTYRYSDGKPVGSPYDELLYFLVFTSFFYWCSNCNQTNKFGKLDKVYS